MPRSRGSGIVTGSSVGAAVTPVVSCADVDGIEPLAVAVTGGVEETDPGGASGSDGMVSGAAAPPEVQAVSRAMATTTAAEADRAADETRPRPDRGPGRECRSEGWNVIALPS